MELGPNKPYNTVLRNPETREVKPIYYKRINRLTTILIGILTII